MGVAAAAAEEAMNNIGGVTMLSYQPTMDRDTEQEAASISLLEHLPPGVPVSSSRAAMLSPMGAMAIITYTAQCLMTQTSRNLSIFILHH